MKIRKSSLETRVMTLALAMAAFVASAAVDAATLTTVAAIPGYSDGSYPIAGLTKLDGKYYGTTDRGGSNTGDAGVVYRIDLKSGAETVLHYFNGTTDGFGPEAGLIAFGGELYGTTTQGGSLGGGTVFAIDPASGAEQVLYNLPADSYAQFALVEFNGLLYGTGRAGGSSDTGFIFSVDPATATGKILYNFTNNRTDGGYPVGLTVRNANLFGATSSGGGHNAGTIFRFDPVTGTVRPEHSFGGTNDGVAPRASLTNVGGILYGTTQYGGASENGTVFCFDPDGRKETVVHSFDGTDGTTPSSTILNVGGLLYGSTSNGGTIGSGTLYSIDPATGATNTIYNFSYPGTFASLVVADGLIYGTMSEGGVIGEGLVYSVDPAAGSFTTVYSFAGSASSINSGLIRVGASLYGVASNGGTRGLGSIFKVDLATGALETVHSFSGADGLEPYGGLVDIGGILYGATYGGGSADFGTVFSFGSASHKLTTLYQFTGGTDGAYPETALSQNNGVLYGTTIGGRGTVFQLDLSSGTLSTLYSFPYPCYGPSSVIFANGLLYGEIEDGDGALYQIDTATGAQSTLYAFRGRADGSYPTGGLLYNNGVLFGTTYGDRKKSPATVFSFDLATATKTTIYTSDKKVPGGPLVAAGDKLYGVATYHGAPYGAVLRLNTTDGAAHLFPLTSAAGGYAEAPLLRIGNAYYGTTQSSDTTKAGTVFKFVP